MSIYYPKIETLFKRNPDTFKVIDTEIKSDVYNLINVWEFTEKVDGTNILINYDPEAKSLTIGGRTQHAQIPELLQSYIESNVSYEALESIFGNKPVIIYGEGYGYKIQNGGDYVDGEKIQKFIVFDIKVGHMYLPFKDVISLCLILGLDVVPFIGEMSLSDGVEMVRNGFKSRLGNKLKDAEGLIGRTRVPLTDNKGRRLIIKLKTVDFDDI